MEVVMKNKKILILTGCALLLILTGIAIFLFGDNLTGNSNKKLKVFTNYDQLFNESSDLYQVKSGEVYSLLDASFNVVDTSNNKFIIIHDGY